MTKKSLFSAFSSGFTMIELLVVTTIIIMLMAVGLVSYQQLGQRARNARRESDLETVRQALVLYRSENGSYPTPGGTWSSLMSTLSPYIAGGTIEDPKNVAPYEYQYVTVGGYPTLRAYQEPAPGTVYDVRLP
jgi:type II secretory pathway pseudopilin PulG